MVRFKQKYKFDLYVDEAHSIGGIGPSICHYFDMNTSVIDFTYGTFSKSFNPHGGFLVLNNTFLFTEIQKEKIN